LFNALFKLPEFGYYRIFTNSKKEGNTVIRELSKILSEMNALFKLPEFG
jgi:hypothetical protein